MSIRSLLAGLAIVAASTASATFLAPCCIGGTIVNAGDGRYFNYGWGPLNQTNSQWYTDAYVNNLSHYTYQAGPELWYGFVHPSTKYEGSVMWHFQTDADTPFGDDVTVTYQANTFDDSYGCWGEWSTDGSTYTGFFHHWGHTSFTVSLSQPFLLQR